MNAIPERFDDSLKARIFPHRFRRVGNPFAFLNDVGIVPILEFLYKGNLLIDVAEALNVSYTILKTWADNEGHMEAIEEAQKISAEGYLADGLRRLREAKTDFELKQAKEMVAHARFMASKKDKTQYGNTEDKNGATGPQVSYVINIAGNVTTSTALPTVQDAAPLPVIEGEATEVKMDLLSHLDKEFEEIFGVPEVKAKKPPAPPKKKGAPLPEIGPFDDE